MDSYHNIIEIVLKTTPSEMHKIHRIVVLKNENKNECYKLNNTSYCK